MGHKTLIGGTAYEISGGKTLIDGTAYSIDKGKTLVDGTAYEVGFAPPTVTITVKNYNSNAGIITYNGVQQTATFTANIGDTIEITRIDVAINNPNATPSRTPYQMLNERTSYTVVSDATFEWKNKFSGVTSTGMYYLLSITEIPEGYAAVTVTGYPPYESSFGSFDIWNYDI